MAFALVENKEFSASGLENLNLKNMSGDVIVTVSEDGKAYVSANKVNFEKNCTLKMNRSGENLIVEVKNEGWFNNDNCMVNFDIKVPKAIALNLKNGFGDLNVNGTKGKIDFKLGSGNAVVNAEAEKLDGKSGSGSINISGIIGDSKIKTGSGSIDITGLIGDADLKTGSGDLKITYKLAPLKGALDIKTGSGDATVFFPTSMKVLTNYMSGSGRIYNELGDSSDASFRVFMKAGSGDLKIKKLQ